MTDRASRLVTRLLRAKTFPAVRIPAAALMLGIAVLAIRRPVHSEINVGAALIWQIWWAGLPFLVLITARLWCSFCPLPLLSGRTRRFGSSRRPPSGRARRAVPWTGAAALLLVGALFLLTSLESNGPLTALLLLVFALGAATAGLLWSGDAWCRYTCPVGIMTGLYSRIGLLRLIARGNPSPALATAGTRVCPVYSSPLSARREQDCVLCGSCMRLPEGAVITASFGTPDTDRLVLQRAESLALGLLAALLLVDAVRMTPLFPLLMSRLVPVMSGDYGRALGLAMAATVLLAILAHTGTALGTGPSSFWAAFSQISAAILPVAFAAQLALSAQHMMATPEVLRNLLAELTLLDPGHMPPPTAYSSLWALKLFQIALLLAGAIIGARIARNTTHRWRSTAYAVGTTVLFVALFLQPMSVTC